MLGSLLATPGRFVTSAKSDDARLEGVGREEAEQAGDLAGHRVQLSSAMAVGSAGGKSRTWARRVERLVRRHVAAVAVDVDRGRLIREPRRTDGVMADEFGPERLPADLGRGRLRDRIGARRKRLAAHVVGVVVVIGA